MRLFHAARLALLTLLLGAGLGLRLWDGMSDRWTLLWSRDPRERWNTSFTDFDTRLRNTIGGWADVHHALLEHTPPDAIVVFAMAQQEDSQKRFGRERKLLFPRDVYQLGSFAEFYRTNPEELDETVFVANLAPGRAFIAQDSFEKVVEAKAFTLWRYRGAP